MPWSTVTQSRADFEIAFFDVGFAGERPVFGVSRPRFGFVALNGAAEIAATKSIAIDMLLAGQRMIATRPSRGRLPEVLVGWSDDEMHTTGLALNKEFANEVLEGEKLTSLVARGKTRIGLAPGELADTKEGIDAFA